jgi:EAL domain-containing protein (putative c-di-GMP-specific phosphodiesterase class I)/cellulose synthase/poly-beta-1,6-N-acetylglucosamine synthase-like glycosyltransferase
MGGKPARGPVRHGRQWGRDRRTAPLPAVPPAVSDRRITAGRLAIVLTVSAWLGYGAYTIEQQFIAGLAGSARLVIEAIVYLLVVTALAASATGYLITRIGFFYRCRAHRRAPRIALDEFFEHADPTVTVLIPSYQEDARVIRTTLLSAALQEQPNLRVVLLIDDPQEPRTAAARRLLRDARRLPAQIAGELAGPAGAFRAGLELFEQAQATGRPPGVGDLRDLAAHYDDAVTWLRDLAARHPIGDHTDVFFAEHVVGALARDLSAVADALHEGATAGAALTAGRIRQLYRRLIATFGAELTSFERKRYSSLSHAPNKAMNLNSYIGLMGGSYQEVSTPLGLALVPSPGRAGELVVPDPDYVLTLDADSMLLPEYCARMVHVLEQGAHARQGVVQTPYSAFPGAVTRLERISGATTDLQHIVHQGMTHYGATFWVGANAVLRKRALDDIMEVGYEGDWQIRRYISDRTVIEDTESTIDLGIQGWSLLNYPERLAYSATPPDFGSLCIQRQRWANGGLLILSKLRQQIRARRSRGEQNRFGEVFLRVNYMASIFWSSVCLLIMMAYPFNAGLLNPILLLVSVPYFVAMASDLRSCGYKRLDVLRIYGFNLILLPVNLSGTFASLLQLVTGEKSAFKRTPKVRDRTTSPAPFLLAPWLLIALSGYTIHLDLQLHRWVNLAFAVLNATLASYAMAAFVGLGNSLADLWAHLRAWLYRPAGRAPVPGGPALGAPAPGATALGGTALGGTALGGTALGGTALGGTALGAPAGRGAVPAPSGAIGSWASILAYGAPGGGNTMVARAHDEPGAAGLTPERGAQGGGRRWTMPTPRSGSFGHFTFFTVFQPIVELESRSPVGYEALTRFADGRTPQGTLDAAHAQGIGIDLDAALVRAAVASAKALPPGTWLSVNVSPELAARTAELEQILTRSPRPVVLEVGAAAGADGAGPQLPAGVMVALDDAGSGYESLARIAQLRPAYLKVGRDAIAGIEQDDARRAIVAALAGFATTHGCTVIAEGIETEAEFSALREIGVRLGQGYFLGRPVPIEHTAEPHPAGTAGVRTPAAGQRAAGPGGYSAGLPGGARLKGGS